MKKMKVALNFNKKRHVRKKLTGTTIDVFGENAVNLRDYLPNFSRISIN